MTTPVTGIPTTASPTRVRLLDAGVTGLRGEVGRVGEGQLLQEELPSARAELRQHRLDGIDLAAVDLLQLRDAQRLGDISKLRLA